MQRWSTPGTASLRFTEIECQWLADEAVIIRRSVAHRPAPNSLLKYFRFPLVPRAIESNPGVVEIGDQIATERGVARPPGIRVLRRKLDDFLTPDFEGINRVFELSPVCGSAFCLPRSFRNQHFRE